VITRFAPTPSGYLHLGNAVNAQLVSWLATANGGSVALRIDDMDAPRFRDEYLQDIFGVLEWLGIDWQLGPTDPVDFAARHSLRHRTERYRAELTDAQARGLELYVCRCSRSRVRGPATDGCPGGCRERGDTYVAGESAIRAHIPQGVVVTVGDVPVDVAREVGDVILWRRDDLPAYHLASLVEDRDLGVTDIVRGEDLRASTAVQLFLAPFLGADAFSAARFVHHALITDESGGKLSKSQAISGRALDRSPGLRQDIQRLAAALGAPHGIASGG
jgi:glutamyl-tRNA synthetase